MSLNLYTMEINVFELVTTLSGNCSRYSIGAWAVLPPAVPYATTTSVNSMFVKFAILNDLTANTRLLIHSYTASFVELQLITELRQPNLG
jgi:hypothetical protein